ncbi:hypothetical protein Acr_05g0007130 [Actinidia rufa]|uniref:Uncharacterized protein n=1 Tax=Actinidia rufa TaxID=165716 RepID=A0A7J0EKT7_9ERIC|nr:hypothetical protein Acr_05g0007130 [Actinidia rufa]
MHGIAEHIRIMNENNALLIQHLTTNNPPPPTAPIPPKLNGLVVLTDQVTVNPRVIKALVGPETTDLDHRAYDLGKKGVLFHQNTSHPAGLAETYKGKINPTDHLDSYKELDDTAWTFKQGDVQSFLGNLEGLSKNLVQKVVYRNHRLIW